MEVAKCPTCDTAITTDEFEEPLTKLALSLGALLINASMMRIVMEKPSHDWAREGFMERLNELSAIAEKDMHELQDWGEAYDGT